MHVLCPCLVVLQKIAEASSCRRLRNHLFSTRSFSGLEWNWTLIGKSCIEVLPEARITLAIPKNVALSEHAKVRSLTTTAVQTDSSLPLVDITSSLVKRGTQMKHLLTTPSKNAPCIPWQNISAQFCKTVKHNNRANQKKHWQAEKDWWTKNSAAVWSRRVLLSYGYVLYTVQCWPWNVCKRCFSTFVW